MPFFHHFLTHHDWSHRSVLISIGGHDYIQTLDNPLKGLVEVLLLKLKLKKGSVHLVQEGHGLDALSDGLTKNSLCLNTNTWSFLGGGGRREIFIIFVDCKMLSQYNMKLYTHTHTEREREKKREREREVSQCPC